MVGVDVRVTVGVTVFVGVIVGVTVFVGVTVDVGVKVGVSVAVGVMVDVGVIVGVGLGVGHISILNVSQLLASINLTKTTEALSKKEGTLKKTGNGVEISIVPASSQYTFRTSQT